MTGRFDVTPAPVRRPAVAGSFYPADPDDLAQLVDGLLAAARPPDDAAALAEGLAGILVPHAGLAYSGPVAAVAWRLVAGSTMSAAATTIVLLGTNHSAGWLDGVGVWDTGAWQTPLGDVEVDADLASEIVNLGHPFAVDRDAHRAEHSLEVQLPFVRAALPGARIVPLAVGTGRGELAVRAGEMLGDLMVKNRATGADVLLGISTDMAHYPPAATAARVTDELAPLILALDPTGLALREADVVRTGLHGVVCGMCGIEPTVVGLATLRAMGVRRGIRLAAATSADVGGPSERTVGYLAAAFPWAAGDRPQPLG
jgi:AmmeMemoRadiSam system protein B